MPESRTSTKRVLEDIGFVRPGGTRSQFWYALDAGKQTIVFTSWVKKANAARTEVQFINVSQPPSRRDPVNLKAARSRVLSIIAEKESYPGGMFMALGEEGPKHANLAPAEGLDLYPIFRFEVQGAVLSASSVIRARRLQSPHRLIPSSKIHVSVKSDFGLTRSHLGRPFSEGTGSVAKSPGVSNQPCWMRPIYPVEIGNSGITPRPTASLCGLICIARSMPA